MPNANLGPNAALAQRIARIESQLQMLATQNTLQNASTTQSDGTVGVQFYQAAGGATVMYFRYGPGTTGATLVGGQWPQMLSAGQIYGAGVGSAVSMARPDNSPSFIANWNGVAILDRASNVVVSDDPGGFGLADPWIPFPTPLDTNISNWPGTAAATMTNISNSNGVLQHSKITFSAQGYAPAGVTGVFALYVNGAQVGSTWTATNNAIATTIQTVTISPLTWQATLSLQVYAQVTAGAGTVRVQVTQIYGRQT